MNIIKLFDYMGGLQDFSSWKSWANAFCVDDGSESKTMRLVKIHGW
jgi:hypothetical protein